MNENRILAAISELGDRMEKRFGVVEGEIAGLKIDVTGLKTDVNGLKTDVSKLQGQISGMAGELDDVKTRLTRIEAAQMVTNGRLDEMGRRMDDQMRVITALIPTRIAAVPPAAE